MLFLCEENLAGESEVEMKFVDVIMSLICRNFLSFWSKIIKSETNFILVVEVLLVTAM